MDGLRRLWFWLTNNWTWRYVGTVRAVSQLVDDEGRTLHGGERRGYWVLTETPTGRRHASREIGAASDSPFAVQCRAQVKAWVAGGPVPELYDASPPAPAPKPRAKLLSFPGGKAG